MANNDLIRRGSVKVLVSDTWWDEIDSIPAVDAVEVVHGEWIVKSGRCSHGVDRRTVMCSICGNYLYLGGVNAGRGDANLCPNCGAQMTASDDG